MAKQKSHQGERKSLKQSSALLWAKPFIQLTVDTTIPRILFYVTNHSKHMHGQHMLNKIVHMASFTLKWRGLCRCMLQGDKLAAGQVHCWPLMVGSRLTLARTVSRTRWKDPPPLYLSTKKSISSSWAVYLRSSKHQWQFQGGKNNLEKTLALIQLSHICRDQLEQSLGSQG